MNVRVGRARMGLPVNALIKQDKDIIMMNELQSEIASVEMEDITVSVPKNAKELADGLGQFFSETKGALVDGFDFSKDGGVIINSFMELLPSLKNFAAVGADIKSDPMSTVVAFLVAAEKALKK